jgi:nucleotide-binding universal stress UspA family protein
MKILVAVDGSPGSAEAVRQAARLSSPDRDQLAFYYSPVAVNFDKSGIDERLLDKAKASVAGAIFDDARTQLPDSWRQKAETIIGDEPARLGILHAARDWKADLIVVGARGLGSLKRLMLGSVSRAVTQAALVPVLVAKPTVTPDDTFRVLVAAEDCHHARQFTGLLNSISWPSDTLGTLLTVVQPMFAGEIPSWLDHPTRDPEIKAMADAWAAEHQQDVAAKQREMQESCDALPWPWKQEPAVVVEGQPAEEIVEAVNQRKVDLLVLGARGANPLTRLLLGSTSSIVVSHAACSVLIVRELQ